MGRWSSVNPKAAGSPACVVRVRRPLVSPWLLRPCEPNAALGDAVRGRCRPNEADVLCCSHNGALGILWGQTCLDHKQVPRVTHRLDNRLGQLPACEVIFDALRRNANAVGREPDLCDSPRAMMRSVFSGDTPMSLAAAASVMCFDIAPCFWPFAMVDYLRRVGNTPSRWIP